MTEQDNTGWIVEEVLGVIGWVIALFIPTIGVASYGTNAYTETTFFWPWFVLSHLEPAQIFQTNQYYYFSVPWTLIIFLPFLYSLKYSYNLFSQHGDRVKNTGLISLMGLLQMGLIGVTYRSQDPRLAEEVTMYYIPELLMFVIFGFFCGIWYLDRSKKALIPAQDQEDNPREQ